MMVKKIIPTPAQDRRLADMLNRVKQARETGDSGWSPDESQVIARVLDAVSPNQELHAHYIVIACEALVRAAGLGHGIQGWDLQRSREWLSELVVDLSGYFEDGHEAGRWIHSGGDEKGKGGS